MISAQKVAGRTRAEHSDEEKYDQNPNIPKLNEPGRKAPPSPRTFNDWLFYLFHTNPTSKAKK
jgi:hypothetical protein